MWLSKNKQIVKRFPTMNKETSKTERLSERLLELFKSEEAFVVSINGEWGVGKTFFWNSFIEDNQVSEKTVYVSLFGKETVKDIQTDIILQLSKFQKTIKGIEGIVGSSKLFGVDLSSALSILSKKDFKKVIVCFDDFERISDNLSLKDVLGLISQLKEQKNCKVVMIYNQDKLEIKGNEVLSSYKDKIIDYELHYQPTVAESYQAASHHLNAFQAHPLPYFELKGINNIRIMKRVVNALNDFEFIADLVKDHSDIESELVSSIIKLSLVNAKYHGFNLENLKSYQERKNLGDKKTEVNAEFEDMFYLFDTQNYFSTSDIFENINNYIKTSIVDKSRLESIVNEKKLLDQNSELVGNIRDIYQKNNYDLTYSKNSFSDDMFNALKQGGDNIVSILEVDSFLFYVQKLEEYSKAPKIRAFAIEKLKTFLDNSGEKESLVKLNSFGMLDKIKAYDPDLKKHIATYELNSKNGKVSKKEGIIEIFKLLRKNNSWGDEPELLEMIDKKVYKKYMLESSVFLCEVHSFIQWTRTFRGYSGFNKAVDKIVDVMWNLVEDKDEIYSFKVEKILKDLNISKVEKTQ